MVVGGLSWLHSERGKGYTRMKSGTPDRGLASSTSGLAARGGYALRMSKDAATARFGRTASGMRS